MAAWIKTPCSRGSTTMQWLCRCLCEVNGWYLFEPSFDGRQTDGSDLSPLDVSSGDVPHWLWMGQQHPRWRPHLISLGKCLPLARSRWPVLTPWVLCFSFLLGCGLTAPPIFCNWFHFKQFTCIEVAVTTISLACQMCFTSHVVSPHFTADWQSCFVCPCPVSD